MEGEKRKRKRRKLKKKHSKSLFVETAGFKSKNTISNNDNACLADVKVPAINSSLAINKEVKAIDIEKDHALSKTQHVKGFKHKRNRISKGRKRMKTETKSTSSNVNDIDADTIAINKQRLHTSDTNQSKSEYDGKLKKGSMPVMQALPSKRNQKLSLKEKLQNKLESGRFRWINEKLYTTSSLSAFEMFTSEPELFDVYHQGFSSQVEKWPVNPVDLMINWIMER
jgi:hypothetical protein